MSLQARRILLWFFLLAFLIAAPLLILYATGFHYSLEKNRWIETGLILVESEPKEVMIYLNEKLAGEKTPLKISALKEGEYRLKLIKEGYRPWEKKIKVEPFKVSFAQNIILFPETKPELKIKTKLETVGLSHNQKNLFYIQDANKRWEIYQWPSSTGNEKAVASLSKNHLTSVEKIFEAPGEQYFLLEGSSNKVKTYLLINKQGPNIVLNLNSWFGGGIAKVLWDPYQDNNALVQADNTLFQFDPEQKKRVAIQGGIIDFEPRREYLTRKFYFLEKKNDYSSVVLKSKTPPSTEEEIISLPYSSSYRLISAQSILAVLDEEHNLFYLIDQVQKKILNIISAENVWPILMNEGKIKFIYQSGGNLKLFETEFKNPHKVSDSILFGSVLPIKITLFSSGNYFLIQDKNKIRLFEALNNPDDAVRELSPLLEAKNLNFWELLDESALIYGESQNGATSIFSLPLKIEG